MRDVLVNSMIASALYDETLFQQLDDDYQIVIKHHSEIQRCLRNLDRACQGYQPAIEAILGSLSVMQRSLREACKKEIPE